MSVEALLDRTVSLDETNIPDHLHMCYLHTSRLLDEVDSLEDVKYVLLMEMMNLARENNALKHDLMTMHQNIKDLVNAVEVLQG
tara:strand:+ start:181 stop:432 length:252 start_codon:yes stop_codon:yes gene_type:complete